MDRRNKVSALAVTLPVGAGVSRWGCHTAHTDTHGHSYFSFDPGTSQQAAQRCQGRYPALSPWCSQTSSIPARASSPPAPLLERDALGGRVGQSPHPRHPPPHLSRGVGAVGPYRAGFSSAAPPCRRSPRSAPAPAPQRSPRPTRDPAAPRPQPPPTPAPPAAAPPLRAVIFIYIKKEETSRLPEIAAGVSPMQRVPPPHAHIVVPQPKGIHARRCPGSNPAVPAAPATLKNKAGGTADSTEEEKK